MTASTVRKQALVQSSGGANGVLRIRGNPFQLFDPQYISPAALARELLAKIEGYPNMSGATLHGRIFTRRAMRAGRLPSVLSCHSLEDLYG